jgi:hypothetical protein
MIQVSVPELAMHVDVTPDDLREVVLVQLHQPAHDSLVAYFGRHNLDSHAHSLPLALADPEKAVVGPDQSGENAGSGEFYAQPRVALPSGP